MGWKDAQKDLVVVTKVYKIVRDVAAVAVKDQESPFAPRFCSRFAVKYLFEPGQPDTVITLSGG